VKIADIAERLEISPVVAAVRGEAFNEAIASPTEVIFLLDGSVFTVEEFIKKAHSANKLIFIHIDLIKGIGKDKCGVEFLAKLGVDGIISTRASLIKNAKEIGIASVQRYFAVDSQGVETAREMITAVKPDFIEIMPGVIDKVTQKFVSFSIPIIAGGLIETKHEVTSALSHGAVAVSTGKKELWSI